MEKKETKNNNNMAPAISSKTATSATNSPTKVGKGSVTKSPAKASTTAQTAKYKQLIKQLKQNSSKQEKLEDEINAIENAIYKRESLYLASTANIIKGFDSYLGSSGSHTHGHYNNVNNGTASSHRNTSGVQDREVVSSSAGADAAAIAAASKVSVLDPNRIFSLSSATFVNQINSMTNKKESAEP